ncbi:bifunctional 4-hydroxy-2-oxoglutarate aldolase/2-dehydro-3-deoxy-phosphogluconate aldolase [Sporolactobacillus shoreicorticis]|uniref:Bifunctional 4-hydroxy-2-oxoglutarate aldolase/2-dehydro-3-deoxy-phosphogluconate aldolase n=1 Tax=Sporolactobacillus shoreicorticis TaxID=1923877 RepID=A0ABW5S188_9BACL|nr:bifunctional 4-hydroxy-2-oxoglutarate aldolase/2-dehydro-3-deoxy-phosphogluconate aldolase [Sporolactobacillus shoreicorticis]MCO7125353.1 bifunctional 4-hydroxy-2-oxoglutarate aldolase/2-dehydro-3-deoxy-phosphogluconate aldolase [Sporolactobacillus shoreicorticis]
MNVTDYPEITVILRGYSQDQAETVMSILTSTKRHYAVEVTMNTVGATEIIRHGAASFGDKLLIGAGTVMTVQDAKQAIDAGARFVLSPTLLPKEVLSLCKSNGLTTITGAYSPSEVVEAFDRGTDIVKIFPAHLNGPGYFQDIQAPLGKKPLMAVGGINKQNARSFLNAGATYLGIGSGIFEKKDILSKNTEHLSKQLLAFEKELEGEKQ